MKNKFDFIQSPLEERQAIGELRQLKDVTFLPNSRVLLQGRELINFSSNDYMGLAEHPLLSQGAADYAQKYGSGSKASRLVSGNIIPFVDLERKLALKKGSEAALIFNSGFQLNVSLIPSLVTEKSLILMDRLIHNSMIQGSLLTKARLMRFRHNDLNHLIELLQKAQNKDYNRILILAETVYSMDGDRADVKSLQNIADEFGAILLVDEAHATGVLGEEGMGLASKKGVDLVMGTFGKAMGSFGAYLTCSRQMKEYLVNYCSGFIYTTALPPQVLGSINAALDLVDSMKAERESLAEKANWFRLEIKKLGLSTLDSSTQIIPIVLGSSQRAVQAADFLQSRGFLATAIRPPTVQEGKARLRIALNRLHSTEDLKQFIQALDEFLHD